MLSVIVLNVYMLSVFILNIEILSVMEQYVFELSYNIEGTTEKVYTFYIPVL